MRMRMWVGLVSFLIDAQSDAVPPLQETRESSHHLLYVATDYIQFLVTVLKDEEGLDRTNSVASSNHLPPQL